MPEMRFVVRWPDGERETCYSPSLAVRDYLSEGESYALADFVRLSREALTIGSDRVRTKYGRACSLALAQITRIETVAACFAHDPSARVECERFLLDGKDIADERQSAL
jgi:uncharacterized repeat protein (TIGR04042 family)